MKKNILRLLSFLICAALMLSVSAAFMPVKQTRAEGRTIFQIESELKECQNMLAALKSELASISSDIAELERQSGQTDKLLESYQAEIEALQAEYEINIAIKESYDHKKADVAAQIAMTEENYNYHRDMYKNLMQFIYENSSVNTFELLFTSDSIADYLSKRDNFNDIMDSAANIMRQIKNNVSDLEILQADLTETQQVYEKYLSDLAKSELELQSKIKQYETIAESLGLNADELREKYSGKNASVAELKARIKKLEEERNVFYSKDSVFMWPLKPYVSYTLTSYYGYRGNPFGGAGIEWHSGIDLACAVNSEIVASRMGTVTTAGWNGGYGNCVIIYHGNGISTLYGHMNRIADGIKVGVTVQKGQVIGYVGTTGRSTGYHLHFSVLNTNDPNNMGGYVNPDNYLPDGYYTKRK
ncbi:MAG: peptidoglycan DD-metalloendopeptidase family protein [Clostridia bacterium]|nr:peptidoglycan DD-metalloendopeptidase family protein [Clostridia bacterium]